MRSGEAEAAARVGRAGVVEPLEAPTGARDALHPSAGHAHTRDVERLERGRAGESEGPGFPRGVGGAEDADLPVRAVQGGGPLHGVVAILGIERGAAEVAGRVVLAVR